MMKIPTKLLDFDGYPTDEFLEFIKNYNPKNMDIHEFLSILQDGWYFQNWGFKLKKKYRGIQKLELHTGGWSGNEDTINAIISNIFLTHFSMKYVMWKTGGHYYFEIPIKK